uniref:Ribonuclease E n=1 Tax=Panagrellus redivivus TaxID=6233 RepID=A0A7E4VVM2_PANRE
MISAKLQTAILAARLTAKQADNDALFRATAELANTNVELQNQVDELQEKLSTTSVAGSDATPEAAVKQPEIVEDAVEEIPEPVATPVVPEPEPMATPVIEESKVVETSVEVDFHAKPKPKKAFAKKVVKLPSPVATESATATVPLKKKKPKKPVIAASLIPLIEPEPVSDVDTKESFMS